jgi:hypothetical protein
MFCDDPIEQIRLAVKELDAEDRRAWSGAEPALDLRAADPNEP